MSQAHVNAAYRTWADPVVRARRLAAIAVRTLPPRTPEHREHQAEGARAYWRRRRLAAVQPFVDRLELMFCPDDEEFTDESRDAVAAVLLELYDVVKPPQGSRL